MKTVRKWLALVLAAGVMVSAMVVFATENEENVSSSPYDSYSGKWEKNENGGEDFIGSEVPSWYYEYHRWFNTSNNEWYVCRDTESGWAWIPLSQYSEHSDSKSSAEKEAEERAAAEAAAEQAIQEQASRDAVVLAGAAMDEGFADVGDMYRAAEKSMSAGEFYNNAVVSTPGIENAVTVGQGGSLIVNGQVTNMSATISKVTNRAYVDSVRIAQEGRVLNVVDVSYPAVEATINFYMPGITGEENIVALQYSAGTWVNVEVAEIRADHVTLNMRGNGVVAFIAQ